MGSSCLLRLTRLGSVYAWLSGCTPSHASPSTMSATLASPLLLSSKPSATCRRLQPRATLQPLQFRPCSGPCFRRVALDAQRTPAALGRRQAVVVRAEGGRGDQEFKVCPCPPGTRRQRECDASVVLFSAMCTGKLCRAAGQA